jgi:hypothetical protein
MPAGNIGPVHRPHTNERKTRNASMPGSASCQVNSAASDLSSSPIAVMPKTAVLAQQFFALGNVGHLSDSDLPAGKLEPDFIFSRPAALWGLVDDGVSEEVGEVGNREYDLVHRHVLPGRDDFLKGPQTDD